MDQVDVNIAVFTNLAADAAEAGGEQDALLAAKGALFRRLSDPNLQRAIINIDGASLLCLTQRERVGEHLSITGPTHSWAGRSLGPQGRGGTFEGKGASELEIGGSVICI